VDLIDSFLTWFMQELQRSRLEILYAALVIVALLLISIGVILIFLSPSPSRWINRVDERDHRREEGEKNSGGRRRVGA
jgi:hypothetical protein